MIERRWPGAGVRSAVLYAVVSSIIAAAQYAPNEWRRPSPPHLHILETVLLNLVGAVLVGFIIDLLHEWATSRLRSALVGVIASLPTVPLVYFTFYPRHLQLFQVAIAMGAMGVIGAMFGAGLWESDD